MKNKLLKVEIISTIFIILLGVMLHFTYDLSNNNIIVGTFSAINESVWEHLKILFVPMFITIIFGYFYFQKDIPYYLCNKTKGLIIALIFIIVIHYSYTGIIGKHIAIIDIITFIIAIIIGEIYTYKKIINNKICNNILSKVILTILCLCFILFTFITPKIGIFKDPLTKTYGINEKS